MDGVVRVPIYEPYGYIHKHVLVSDITVLLRNEQIPVFAP